MLNIKSMINNAISKAGEEQPWDGYYLIRGFEIENLLRFIKLNSLGMVLDLGCGNGFISYLLSSISKRVIATDLPSSNLKTHTIGIDITKRFISKMGNGNVTLLVSAMEYTPFKDDTFDTVFSSYAIQYLNHRPQALKEIKRVVKKDGIIILILPNFMERIYAFIQFYLYFVIRFFRIIVSKVLKVSRLTIDKEKKISSYLAEFKYNYRKFLFPEPDGTYKNFIIEMVMYLPLQWNKMFRKMGFKIVSSFTTIFLPFPLLFSISLKANFINLKVFRIFTKIFSDKPFIKYLGYSYCVILKK